MSARRAGFWWRSPMLSRVGRSSPRLAPSARHCRSSRVPIRKEIAHLKHHGANTVIMGEEQEIAKAMIAQIGLAGA